MSNRNERKQEWVKMISRKELENRLKEAKILAATAKEKISFYEKEIERRKQEEISLGVPYKGNYYLSSDLVLKTGMSLKPENRGYNSFHSKKSAEKHAEMLLAWRQALVANAKGELMDIRVLLPLLQKGYVAMDENKRWYHYKHEPTRSNSVWTTTKEDGLLCLTNAFNIKPVEDWTTSLMECGL